MTGVGLWLLVVAAVDLLRAGADVTSRARRAALSVLLVVALVGVALLAGPAGCGGWCWAVAVAGALTWLLGSSVALRPAPAAAAGGPVAAPRRPAPALLAYAGLLVGLGAVLLAGDRAGSLGWGERVLAGTALSEVGAERVLVVVAVLLAQVATANTAVRLLLDVVGVPAHDNEKQLRGGRVLGPMERVLITGLGAAGNLTGAAVVVAAKALLRFPELRTPRAGTPGHGGPSDVTEYFLVGSFASWLVALGGAALVLLS